MWRKPARDAPARSSRAGPGPAHKPPFDEQALQRLGAEFGRRPDITLKELRGSIGIDAHLSPYCNLRRDEFDWLDKGPKLLIQQRKRPA